MSALPADTLTSASIARPRRPGLGMARPGLGIIGALTIVALLASLLAQYDPQGFVGNPLQAPSPFHLLGTNESGQDIFAQLLYGTRVTLLVAPITAALAMLVAVTVGVAAALAGRRTAIVMARIIDMWLAVPKLPLLLLLAITAGSSLPATVIIMALLFWPAAARQIRAQTLSIRQRDFVSAARGMGAGSLQLARRHLLPALIPIVVTGLVQLTSVAAVLQAGLAFLGVGDPHTISWGLMINQAVGYPALFVGHDWLWWLVPPALALTLTVLGFAFIGMGLEPRLHPQLVDHLA